DPFASGPPSRLRWCVLKIEKLTRVRRACNTLTGTQSRTVEGYSWGVTPEPLERVVCACLLQEHVHQHVAVVKQDPAARGDALGVEGSRPFALEFVADRVGDGLQVSRGLAAAEEEVVGDAREPLHVEHDQVRRALVAGGARGAPDLALGREPRHAPSARYNRFAWMKALTDSGSRQATDRPSRTRRLRPDAEIGR